MTQWTAWRNIHLVTMQQGQWSTIENGAIILRDDEIAWLGSEQSLAQQLTPEVQIHDGGGYWVTPGLIDCHTHLVYGGNRADEFQKKLNGVSYEDIAKQGGGIRSTLQATAQASREVLFAQAAKRLQYFLNEGVTTIEIKSGYGGTLDVEQKMLEVAKQLDAEYPISVIKTFLGAHVLPDAYKDDRTNYIQAISQEMLPHLHQLGLVDQVDAFCESIAFSALEITPFFHAAQALGLPIKCHAEQLSNSGGIQLAARFKAISVEHLEYANLEDIQALQASNTAAVLLPGAFYNLREIKLPPIALLREHQIPIAIASDCNPGSSPLCSLLLTLNLACNCFRLTPEEALAGVTCHAATALGIKDRGVLEVGKKADLVFWDINQPEELAYYIGHNPCKRVLKAGKMVLERN